MKKEIQVKAHTRKTKSGKTVTVKAHTVSRESADSMAKEALKKKKGSGKELQKAKDGKDDKDTVSNIHSLWDYAYGDSGADDKEVKSATAKIYKHIAKYLGGSKSKPYKEYKKFNEISDEHEGGSSSKHLIKMLDALKSGKSYKDVYKMAKTNGSTNKKQNKSSKQKASKDTSTISKSKKFPEPRYSPDDAAGKERSSAHRKRWGAPSLSSGYPSSKARVKGVSISDSNKLRVRGYAGSKVTKNKDGSVTMTLHKNNGGGEFTFKDMNEFKSKTGINKPMSAIKNTSKASSEKKPAKKVPSDITFNIHKAYSRKITKKVKKRRLG